MLRSASVLKSAIKSNSNLFHSHKFSTIKDKIPNIISSLLHRKKEPIIKFHPNNIEIGKQIVTEFNQNIFAKDLLINTDKLLRDDKLRVSQAANLKESEKDYLDRSALFYYNGGEKLIRLPDSINSPYLLMPFLKAPYHNFHSNQLSYFVGSFLHECLHAVDDLIAELSVTEKDRRYIQEEYEWLVTGTDFTFYEKPELQAFCQAIIADKKSLAYQAEKGDGQAKRFLHFINLIDDSYTKYNFIDEMKAFLVQFTVQGAFEANQVQKYLPAMSDWYFSVFMPLVQNKLSDQANQPPHP